MVQWKHCESEAFQDRQKNTTRLSVKGNKQVKETGFKENVNI